MWKIIYNYLFLPLTISLLKIAKHFNYKIKIGVEGRINLFIELRLRLVKIEHKKRIWFHSSSMGEFEQVKPIIAEIKKQFPEYGIVTTFFSPSGYLNSLNYKNSDIISYLPLDTKTNVNQFLDLVKPEIAIMVRYDVWPNFAWESKRRNIPLILVNGTLKNNSKRFLPIVNKLHSEVFNCFTNIFTVTKDDKLNFDKLNVVKPKIEATGDTRFDQVIERRDLAHKKHLLPTFITDGKIIFIAAQTWREDEEVIFPGLSEMIKQNPNILTIIVPHEPTENNLERIESEAESNFSTIRFSLLNDFNNESAIIVDSIGVLVAFYQYADLVYVGGSFKQGIHNVLEPSAFGVPIIFGPNHLNSQEAVELKKISGAFEVNNSIEFLHILKKLINDVDLKNNSGFIAKNFVEQNLGATKIFMDFLTTYLKN